MRTDRQLELRCASRLRLFFAVLWVLLLFRLRLSGVVAMEGALAKKREGL
ncbi:hypothetical protein KYG_04704 [Acidovorax sp. NO-1]|jgi:hypothetical protein|nr:hypothetical protein KYG_04704 [Acidovorax sp. NO-1]